MLLLKMVCVYVHVKNTYLNPNCLCSTTINDLRYRPLYLIQKVTRYIQ